MFSIMKRHVIVGAMLMSAVMALKDDEYTRTMLAMGFVARFTGGHSDDMVKGLCWSRNKCTCQSFPPKSIRRSNQRPLREPTVRRGIAVLGNFLV